MPHLSTCISLYMYVSLYVHVCVYLCVFVYMYMYVRMCVCICVCTCMCMFVIQFLFLSPQEESRVFLILEKAISLLVRQIKFGGNIANIPNKLTNLVRTRHQMGSWV